MKVKRIRMYFIPVVLSFACVLSGCSSNVTSDNLHFTVNHFSKFAIIAKIKTALASSEKDINTSTVQEEKKFTVINAKGAKSTPTNPPKTLPKTGETNNNILTLLGISLIALTALLKRRKNR